MSTQLERNEQGSAADAMPLLGLDHVELWVGNATQAVHYFVTAYGFREVAAAGLGGDRRVVEPHGGPVLGARREDPPEEREELA